MRRLLYTLLILTFIGIATVTTVILSVMSDVPRLPDDLKQLASSPATEIYARDGSVLETLGGRTYVPLDRISTNFQAAIIAVEDRNFYKHHGIDHLATLAGILQNIRRGGGAPGRSTITQQLAKNLFFNFDRSIKRKILEALAAFAIEDRFTKDQILEAYCNLITFSPYDFGVERAAQTFFGKHASDLNIEESALLAGLPNSPSNLNPFFYLERAKDRQKRVLHALAAIDMISPANVDSLFKCELNLLEKSTVRGRGSYAVDLALSNVRRDVGSEIVKYGGVLIYTGLDQSLQRLAQRVVSTGVDELDGKLKPLKPGDDARLEGALVAVDIRTGRIAAIVGGKDYIESPYNRAAVSLRAPGSSFKPMTYLTALMQSDTLTPVTVMNDSLIAYHVGNNTWKPTNFSNTYQGSVTVKQALMSSLNTIAAQLIFRVTPEEVVQTAKLAGVKSKLQPMPSLALGAQGVTVIDMATMFATLARGGIFLPTSLVARVEGRGGDILFEALTAGTENLPREHVYQMLDMLQGVIEGGTGVGVKRYGFTKIAAGKTGTSNDYRDSWFVGATPNLAVAVWVGYDDNRQMRFANGKGVTGASGALPIWADFMARATAHEPSRDFPRPDGVVIRYADPITGELSDEPLEGYIRVALIEQ
ncbi:transglycosylase domain-containing protein [Calditrichota bacterium]